MVLIYPEWIVNSYDCAIWQYSETVLIYPEWIVNPKSSLSRFTYSTVLIYPEWIVNNLRVFRNVICKLGFNLSRVDCKLCIVCNLRDCRSVLIYPEWIVNLSTIASDSCAYTCFNLSRVDCKYFTRGVIFYSTNKF